MAVNRAGQSPPRSQRAAAKLFSRADVAELVDAHGSGPCGGNPVEVQVLSSAFSGLAEISASQRVPRPAMYRSDARSRWPNRGCVARRLRDTATLADIRT